MPVLQPAENWKRSGRYDIDEVFKLQDRRGAELVLALSHEENLTFHMAREVRSYRDLPKLLYHFQTKERDEARPRAGVLRTREFIMKDAYSFDRDREGLERSYAAPRGGLRPHLRPRGARVVPGGVRRGHDGRLRRARVHGALPGRARTTWPSPPPATPPTWRWRAPRRSRWTGCPRPWASRERVETPGRHGRARGRRCWACPRARSSRPCRCSRRGRARAGAHPRRPSPQRDQAPERARRGGAAGRGGRGARACSAPSPASSAPWARACEVVADEALRGPARPGGRRERAPTCTSRGVEPGRDFEPDVGRRAQRSRRATPLPGRRRRSASSPPSRSGNIFKLGTRYSEPLGATLPRRRRAASSSSGWGPTGSARRASWPPRSSRAPTSRASPGRAPLAPFDVELVTLGKEGEEARDGGRPPLRRAARDRARGALRRPRAPARARSSPTPSCSAARCA